MIDFGKLIAPYARRISNMLARGSVTLADSSKKMQLLQVKLLAGETRDNIEHFEPYGFTSNPHPGAEPLAAFLGGDRSHGVVLVVADRRYRLVGLAEGEAALYDDQGQKVHLTRMGIVISGAAKPITIQNFTDLNITGTGTINQTMAGGTPLGVVQGDCICAWNGQKHPMVSTTVKATK